MRPRRSLPVSPPEEGGVSAAHNRAGDGLLLASTMMAASLVQFSVGALAPLILVDLDISRARLGVLLSCYYLIAALTSPAFGRLTGRIGGSAGLKLVVLLAVGGNLAVSTADSQGVLVVGLVLAGLAVAAANPATNLAIAQLPPPHGVLVGIKQSGFQFAAVVAGSLVPLVARFYGWRTSFAFAATLCLVVFGSLLRWRPDRVESPPLSNQSSPVATVPGVGVLSAYAFFMGIGIANVGVYLTLFAHERLAFPEQTAGAVVAIVGVGAVVARIAWNVLIERGTGRFTDQRSVLFLIALISIAATGAVVASERWHPALVWGAALALGISAAAWNGVVMLGLVRRTSAPRVLGKASGRVQGAFFAGLATGPPVFGLLVDRGGNYAFGWLWTALSFVAALVVVLRLPATAPRVAIDEADMTIPREELQ